jgi:hypothetical protein
MSDDGRYLVSKKELAGEGATMGNERCQGKWWWEMLEVRTATLGRVVPVDNNRRNLGIRGASQ